MTKKEFDPVSLFIKLNKKNDYEYARKAFGKLLLKDPLNTRLLFQLGNVHSLIGKNPKKAIEVFNHLLNLEKDNLSARNNKAVCLMEIKEYKQAIREFTVVLKSESNAIIYKQRAFCYEKLSEHKKALADLKEAIKLLESAR